VPASRHCNGRARCVEAEDLSVQPAILVEIAAGDLDASRVLSAAGLDRLEPGGSDSALPILPTPMIAVVKASSQWG
jgi:hypothetical protein